MKKYDFNDNWKVSPLTNEKDFKVVTLPYDAMIYEKRTKESMGGLNIGWFEGLDYVYEKEFTLGDEFKNKVLNLEFEGVYHLAEVYVNDIKVAFRPYGYSNFFAEHIEKHIKYNNVNVVRVLARNSNQPNSRWYSGTGIYRPVWLYVGEETYIENNGVKITTKSINPCIIEIEVNTNKSGILNLSIPKSKIKVDVETTGRFKKEFIIENPKLWSDKSPFLYECIVTFGNDVVKENFGIRTIGWDTDNGFTINGQREILRGACIHHDNGVLGACTYPEVEKRRVKILKENGYNAIRSAHNPCSKYLLEACDELGIYVLDEFVDVWYIHKTQNDYVDYFEDWWQEDLADMVKKDYNHPCVVMYSIGNEVSETAQKKGIELTKKMTEHLHRLDGTRPVTCGINIFFNFLSSIGFGVYSDEKAKKEIDNKKKNTVGSEFFNNMAGVFGSDFMKRGATLKQCDLRTKDAFANMDIAGYNYGILRYKKDLNKYSKRLILGTETFCSDSFKFWELAKKNKGIVGDFVWAGMDYLGEVGIGAWEYNEYAENFDRGVGWLTAGSGRIDITGKPIGEALYTKVAFELENKPVIAVRPVNCTKEKHSPSAWKMTNALNSWSFRGFNNSPAIVEVYARCHRVKLYINNKVVGQKVMKNDCKAIFNVKYENGNIRAIAFDKKGKEISNSVLFTAGQETLLNVSQDTPSMKVYENTLTYLRISYQDRKGTIKPLMRGEVHIDVEGCDLVAVGNGCSFNKLGYVANTVETYYGEAIAVIRPSKGVKETKVKVYDGKVSSSIKLNVLEKDVLKSLPKIIT
ncbi:MAG: glycoside hydrolase family 2 TIM barrel-domain containing protein [Lachnospirales bacterium]